MMLRWCEFTLLGVARSVPVWPAEGAEICPLRRWVPEGECFLCNDPNLCPCLVVGRLHAFRAAGAGMSAFSARFSYPRKSREKLLGILDGFT